MPPSPPRLRADQLQESNDCPEDTTNNGPPVVREKSTRLDKNPGQHRQLPPGFLEQGHELRDKVSHEKENQANPKDKNDRRINQRTYNLLPQIVHRDQKRCLTTQEMRQRTAQLACGDQVAKKISER